MEMRHRIFEPALYKLATPDFSEAAHVVDNFVEVAAIFAGFEFRPQTENILSVRLLILRDSLNGSNTNSFLLASLAAILNFAVLPPLKHPASTMQPRRDAAMLRISSIILMIS